MMSHLIHVDGGVEDEPAEVLALHEQLHEEAKEGEYVGHLLRGRVVVERGVVADHEPELAHTVADERSTHDVVVDRVRVELGGVGVRRASEVGALELVQRANGRLGRLVLCVIVDEKAVEALPQSRRVLAMLHEELADFHELLEEEARRYARLELVPYGEQGVVAGVETTQK